MKMHLKCRLRNDGHFVQGEMGWNDAWRQFSSVNVTFILHGPLARYVKLRVAHAPGMPGTFLHHPDMHHGTCVKQLPWCMLGSLTSGFLWSWWREKLSQHSRRMRNPQFKYQVRGPWRMSRLMTHLTKASVAMLNIYWDTSLGISQSHNHKGYFL